MKFICSVILLTMTMVFMLPCTAHALDNKVEMSYELGTGEYLTAEVDNEVYSFSYRRYLQRLADNGSPYGAREFLQHPSYLDISLVNTQYRYDYSLPATDIKSDYTEYTASAMYFIGNGRSTGIGARYGFVDGESTGAFVSDIRESAVAVTVQQYLADAMRLTLDYEILDAKEPYGEEFHAQTVEVSTLQEKYWINLRYINNWNRSNDTVSETVGLEIGFYPLKEFGVFASVDKDDSSSTYKARAEYWLGDRAMLEFIIKGIRNLENYYEGESATIKFGVLF